MSIDLTNLNFETSRLETYFSDPAWYLNLLPEIDILFYGKGLTKEDKTEEFTQLKEKFRNQLAALFKQGKISLGSVGMDLDAQRKPIDTVVIHHTSSDPSVSIDYLDIAHLFRLYVPEYREPKRAYYQKPLWSGHFRNGQQTFIAYHYLIRQDGSFVQALDDKYIGWQCGNWEINCSSVAVTFIDELENARPTPQALKTAQEIIARYQGAKILGHREIVETVCPGNLFLGENGWKQELKS